MFRRGLTPFILTPPSSTGTTAPNDVLPCSTSIPYQVWKKKCRKGGSAQARPGVVELGASIRKYVEKKHDDHIIGHTKRSKQAGREGCRAAGLGGCFSEVQRTVGKRTTRAQHGDTRTATAAAAAAARPSETVGKAAVGRHQQTTPGNIYFAFRFYHHPSPVWFHCGRGYLTNPGDN